MAAWDPLAQLHGHRTEHPSVLDGAEDEGVAGSRRHVGHPLEVVEVRRGRLGLLAIGQGGDLAGLLVLFRPELADLQGHAREPTG
ncbi:MAG: hypothetical protein ACRDHH_08030 [Actinomycetota bacterium]